MVAWPCSAWPPGSSPRPWGTRMTEPRTPTRTRFIPTPVGNTSGSTSTRSTSSVHPHARGEHAMRKHAQPSRGGSSPRPWGTRLLQQLGIVVDRFIPTPVGNTQPAWPRSPRRSVHPHARGEHEAGWRQLGEAVGSSPRPWGTQGCAGCRSGCGRFIPTPVGNTRKRESTKASRSVHPHARGEHGGGGTCPVTASGSSPRPWGTQRLDRHVDARVRFIPTPVGNTPPADRPRPGTPVHPHARGEHAKLGGMSAAMFGSSPRPWGTLLE